MGKLLAGFILGFLACVWTYGLDPMQAAFSFGRKVSVAHEHIQHEYRIDSSHGHKGQYGQYRSVSPSEARPDTLANPIDYWLSQQGGPPVM